ncbi:MAG: ArsR family transcriptional regulator [Gammaproteobacteria bacterium]|nr:MAG: ArsR family transcriptional regulator [Gammaproteobacteria bacterium]
MHQAVHRLSEPQQIQALAHPLRLDVIAALREPDSAAGVARQIGRPRQQVNYHLKELARVGLVTPAGERRKGNFIEQLYQAVARRFVVSSRFTWNQEQLEATLRDQVALAQLTELGERLQRDAARLIDAAMMDGTEIPSVSAVAEVRFENETARARFLEEYMDALQKLLNKHGGTKGEAFRVTFAAYPELEDA